ncbi:MAG: hypothetical protein HYR72_09480 [Deltaproteobacteria bacterium]|nr:hypothetical protein [Deltaproteobacteria bacterium]MBI3387929.1 hypothetical protein [Deltaproteobacteria bacterium]
MVWTARPIDLVDKKEDGFANYASLFPTEWINRHSARSLWIEAYRVPYPPVPDAPDNPRSADLGNVCATFIRSVLTYQSVRTPVVDISTPEALPEIQMHPPQMQIPHFMDDWVPKTPKPEVRPENPDVVVGNPSGGFVLVMHNVQVVNHRSNLGTFVILATPHHTKEAPGNEDLSKERLKTTAGLLGAVMGRNAIYEPLFSFQLNLDGTPVDVGSVVFENPANFRAPNLTEGGLALVEVAAAYLSRLPAETRDRAELSLRWLYEAMTDKMGIFAFVKYWIAIETLTMVDTTNISPVVRRLAFAYNCSEAAAKSRFLIGRLANLRGEIVHKGRTLAIGQDLLSYIEAVYVDVLAQVLGLTSGRMVERALKTCGRTALELMQAATPIARRRLQVRANATRIREQFGARIATDDGV